MAPPVTSLDQFCVHAAVMEGASEEIRLGPRDLGPTDSLPPEELLAAQVAFFGLGPSVNEDKPSPPPLLSANTHSSTSPAEKMSSRSDYHPAGNSATRKRKRQSRLRREEARREENAKKPRYGEGEGVQAQLIADASTTAAPYNMADALVASTGFVAQPDGRGSVHTLNHLIGKLGFRYVEATEG